MTGQDKKKKNSEEELFDIKKEGKLPQIKVLNKDGSIKEVREVTKEYVLAANEKYVNDNELVKDQTKKLVGVFEKANDEIKINDKKESSKSGFILDSEEVWDNKLFVFDRLNKDIAYFGMLLPKLKDNYDKKGNYLYTAQIRSPAIITSDRKILPVNMRLKEEYKINMADIPGELNLRWQLESIKFWINGKENAKPIKDIFEKIKSQYEKFISMSPIWCKIHALWDMGTYQFSLFKVYPLFEQRGLMGTGKSKCMAVSRLVTLNSTNIMINPSEATLFRETHEKRPTKYIDEAESLFRIYQGKVEPDSRVEVINSSYRFDGCVPRQEKINGKFVTVYYHTYSPTMISSINGLHGATENRAIIRITTHPKKEDEAKGNIEPDQDNPIWQVIRNDLYIFALENWKSIAEEYQDYNNTTGLKNRDYWLWKPLLILAKRVSQELYDEVLQQALKQQETKQADFIREDSNDYRILEIVYSILKASDKVYVKDIHDQLPESQYKPKPRTISGKLDKLGFRDFRGKDRNGSFFKIDSSLFEGIIVSICPSIFSSQSSQSSQNNGVIENKEEEIDVTKRDECDESKEKDVTNVTIMTNVTINSTVALDYIRKNPQKTFMEIQKGTQIPKNDLMAILEALQRSGGIYEHKPNKWVIIE